MQCFWLRHYHIQDKNSSLNSWASMLGRTAITAEGTMSRLLTVLWIQTSGVWLPGLSTLNWKFLNFINVSAYPHLIFLFSWLYRFCGRSRPAVHMSYSNIVTIHYVTSTNNTGQKHNFILFIWNTGNSKKCASNEINIDWKECSNIQKLTVPFFSRMFTSIPGGHDKSVLTHWLISCAPRLQAGFRKLYRCQLS